jgi:hypothetical protein
MRRQIQARGVEMEGTVHGGKTRVHPMAFNSPGRGSLAPVNTGAKGPAEILPFERHIFVDEELIVPT